MKIFYQRGEFISHARAGADNMLALKTAGHELVGDPAQADVAILHDEPIYYPKYLSQLKGLSLPKIAYCVVETDPMPPAYLPALKEMDEIWTCSAFSRDILAAQLKSVHVIPHVVRRTKITGDDLRRVQEFVGPADGAYTFYTVSDGINPRKNLAALLRAFTSLGSTRRYRLVVKQYRQPIDLSSLPGVVSITDRLTDAEMAALHTACDCYVSPHCAEAWGLSLSEAMAFGNPVIATGYSGNMEFMNEANSLPVKYEKKHISADDINRCPPFFTSEMKWAYVDEADFVLKMRQAPHVDSLCVRNASTVAQTYAPKLVGKRMNRRLQEMFGNTTTVGVA